MAKKVCKTNIVKCLRESWDTAEIIPINERWACGITVRDNGAIEFNAVLTHNGMDVSNFWAWCNYGTAKKDIFEYCTEKMLSDYANHVRYEGIDLDALDKSAIVAGVGEKYDYLYDHYDEVNGYDEAMALGDWIIRNRREFVSELARIRGDVFSSDREVAALGFAVNELVA